MSFVRRGLVVPDCAATHPHWFVQLFVTWAHYVFANRASLQRPVRDLNGHVLVPAMPEWYVDPYPGERTAALAKRRADWIERRLQVILVVVAHMSFREKVVLPDPDAPDFMTMDQIGRELPNQKCKDPVDSVERPMRFIKMIGFFSKVVQHRQKLVDGPNAGKFRSAGAALRRVATAWMGAAEGMIAGGWQRLQNYLKDKAAKYAEAKAKADKAFTDQLTRKQEPLVVPPRKPPPPAVETEKADPIWDEVETDHPEWVEARDIARIRTEVNLRRARQRDTS
jgi:hypothetical protein